MRRLRKAALAAALGLAPVAAQAEGLGAVYNPAPLGDDVALPMPPLDGEPIQMVFRQARVPGRA